MHLTLHSFFSICEEHLNFIKHEIHSRVGQLTTGGLHVGVRPVCKQVTVCVVVVPGQVHVITVLSGYCPVKLGGHGVGGAEHPTVAANDAKRNHTKVLL